jgi:CRISPR/Cas system-associated endoribonuclease Cas2
VDTGAPGDQIQAKRSKKRAICIEKINLKSKNWVQYGFLVGLKTPAKFKKWEKTHDNKKKAIFQSSLHEIHPAVLF